MRITSRPRLVDADRRADRVHHVDRIRSWSVPTAAPGRRKGFEVSAPTGQRSMTLPCSSEVIALFEIGGDLGILAAADQAELGNAGDLGGEADAARAVDAAVHDRLDQRADILVLDRALVLLVARGIDAEGHRLVLQVALAALVADRAIERMVDQQELHHAFAGLLDHRRVGEDLRRLAVRAGAQVAHAHGAGGLRLRRPALHLDQAHAAVAGDRQPLVEAEARHLRARLLRRLQQRVVVGYLDLFAVDLELSHCRIFAAHMPAAVRTADAVEHMLSTSRYSSVTFLTSHAAIQHCVFHQSSSVDAAVLCRRLLVCVRHAHVTSSIARRRIERPLVVAASYRRSTPAVRRLSTVVAADAIRRDDSRRQRSLRAPGRDLPVQMPSRSDLLELRADAGDRLEIGRSRRPFASASAAGNPQASACRRIASTGSAAGSLRRLARQRSHAGLGAGDRLRRPRSQASSVASISAFAADFGLAAGERGLALECLAIAGELVVRSARTAAATPRQRRRPRPSRGRKPWLARPMPSADIAAATRRADERSRLTALAISCGSIAGHPGSSSRTAPRQASVRQVWNTSTSVVSWSILPSARLRRFRLGAFGPHFDSSTPPPPAPARPGARCAKTRRCAAPPRRGNAASGPGSARPPRRPARRSCGPRPAW